GHFRILPSALPAKPFGPSSITTDIQADDLNNDGHADLVISYSGPNPPYYGRYLQVLINHGDGTFRDETAARLPQQPSASGDGNWLRFLSLEDVNGDGSADIATQTDVWPDSSRDETQPVYLNDGTGHFSPIPAPAVPRKQPGLYLFLDVDGDEETTSSQPCRRRRERPSSSSSLRASPHRNRPATRRCRATGQ